MTDAQTLRVRTPEDLLEAVPRLLGYSPYGSLVAIPLSGKHGGMVLRFDLPVEHDDPRSADARVFADAVMAYLARLDAVTRVVLVFAPDVEPAEGSTPFLATAQALLESLDRSGIDVVWSLWRTRAAWGRHFLPGGVPEEAESTDVLQAWPEPAAPAHALPRASEEEAADFRALIETPTSPVMTDAQLLAVIERLVAEEAEPKPEHAAAVLRCMLEAGPEAVIATIAFGSEAGRARRLDAMDPYALLSPGLLTSLSVRRAGKGADVLRLAASLATSAEHRVLLHEWAAWLKWSIGANTAALVECKRAVAACVMNAIVPSQTVERVYSAVNDGLVPSWIGSTDWAKINRKSDR